MRTLILRNLVAQKGRLLLTLIAVTLSVSFVAASFILADSLRGVFGTISNDIYSSVDAEVRAGDGDFDRIASGVRFDDSVVAEVAALDSVALAVPGIGSRNLLMLAASDGEALRPDGPPILNFAYGGSIELSPFEWTAGRPPGPGEIVLDEAQLAAAGVEIGDPVTVITPEGLEEFTVTGTVVFGDAESSVIPYFLIFDTETNQRLLDSEGLVDSVTLAYGDDANRAQAAAEVASVIGEDLIVVDSETLIAEQESEFGVMINIIQAALLVFAGITFLVATFVIANTFSVLVSQRTRQIALMRSIGASARQVRRMILAEAMAIGTVASLVGLVAGLGVAQGIKAIFEAGGGGFPNGTTEIRPRTFVVVLVVGVGVTVASALLPARNASRLAPLEALRAQEATSSNPSSLLSRLIRLAAAPMGWGVVGRMTTLNSTRNSRRTLTTAMSTVVGIGVISAVAVFGSSYRETLSDNLNTSFDADLMISGDRATTISSGLVPQIAGTDGVEAVSGFGSSEVLVGGSVTKIGSLSSATVGDAVDFGLVEGRNTDLSESEIVVSDVYAGVNHLALGDTVAIEFSDRTSHDMAVVGVFSDHSVIGADLMVDHSLLDAHARNHELSQIVVRYDEGVDAASVRRALDPVLASQPQAVASSLTDYLATQEAQANQLLALASALLVLTLVISLTGIANTQVLLVLDRTRELGLLRSIGMSRRQVRSMVRREAVTTSALGSVLGVLLGAGIMVVVAALVSDTLIARVVLPYGTLAAYAVISVILGALAATLPAFRASRMNPLEAISSVE